MATPPHAPWALRARTAVLLAAAALTPLPSAMAAPASGTGVEGDWITPDRSALRIAPCGGDLCIKITRLPPNTPATVDGFNPDAQLRKRPLCGLEIGSGFRAAGPGRAEGGMLYDPKSGRTYHGAMMVEGDSLRLRGYVGIKLFGRSETWTRAKEAIPACARAG